MNEIMNFALFGSGLTLGIVVAVLLLALFFSEKEEHGVIAFVSVLVFLVLNYFGGNIPVEEYLSFDLIWKYLLIGFIFSLIRTFFKGKELDKLDKARFALKEHVFRWWFMWPISFLYWVFGTLLNDLFSFLYKRVASIYDKLFNL